MGYYEEIDPRYVIEPSWKFQLGEVFKVLWSEPLGSGRERKTIQALSEKGVRDSEHGEKFHVGFRRFIIVSQDEGHSTCVPILTYGRMACKKQGVKPQKHGIIHRLGKPAKLLDGEPKLGFQPVRMKINVESERLAKESRVDYSKLITVEHNVKVFFIGQIVCDDIDLVAAAVEKCWYNKQRWPKSK